MAALERFVAQRGYRLVRLETGIHQPEAMALFHRFGYETTDPFGDYAADDPYSVFLEKRVQGLDD